MKLKEKIRNYRLQLNGRSLPIGMGCAWVGRHMEDEHQVTREIKLLDACYLAGFRYFDTSCDYGDSEDLMGKWLKNAPRQDIFLCTKGRYPYHESKPLDTLKRNFYESFERLGVDHIDMYLVHDAEAYGRLEQEALPFLLERKAEGMINYIGQGTRDNSAHLHAILDNVMDGVLSYLQFNLVNTSAKTVADKAREYETTFINGSPLAGGIFLNPALHRDYRRNRADIAFGTQMRELLSDMKIDPIAAALQFPVQFSQIDMTLNGISNQEELHSSLSALSSVISPEQWARIYALQNQYRYIDCQSEYMK